MIKLLGGDSFLVGRQTASSGTAIAIPCRWLSRGAKNLKLYRDQGRWMVTDLGSTNHVFVNGEQAEVSLLADGDKIQLGDVVLSFELHDAIDERFHNEIRARILYDDLTGLLTYESFRTALAWELERYGRVPKGCAIVMMDLDDFKKLNDTYGHPAGDAALRHTAQLLAHQLRKSDLAARFGGEEFAVILASTDRGGAEHLAEKVRAEVERGRLVHDGARLGVTVSIGVAVWPGDGRDPAALVAAADRALYAAKEGGRNRVVSASAAPAVEDEVPQAPA